MSIRHIPYGSEFDIDYHREAEEARRRRAFTSLSVSDVLATLDDLIAAEPGERKHPLFHLAEFLLDRCTSVDGGALYDSCRALVLTAIDRCVADALQGEG